MTTATVSMKYSLEQIEDIIFQGFDYCVPDDVMEKISNLAMQVGSPDYVKTPVFKKRENPMKVEPDTISPVKDFAKKRRGGKAMEVLNDDDWESIRTFQTTKMETKTGVDAEFDSIRGFINKMTDKNYIDMRNKIVEVIERLVNEQSDSDLSGIGANIFEIASSNRYYSKMYADLYADLSSKFAFIKTKSDENFKRFGELFQHIEYVDPNENYDRFCEINKVNEKRKSLATFYVNLMNCGIITPVEIIAITRDLLDKVYQYIRLDNKKNEVEELTETIALLYKKELYEDDHADNYEQIDGYTISEVIERIAKSKVKDYKSLTTKALFKFMDLIEM
ncbi:MAG: hypothetical protein ACOVRN_16845 [Flavobacterium sp.]